MKSPCRHPGCPSLVKGTGYCEEHKADEQQFRRDYERKRKSDPALARAARLRSSTRWQRVRLQKLARDPLCEDPFGDHQREGETQPGQQVHHVEGVATRPDLAFTLSNLQTVCTRCHARLEALERGKA